MNDIVSMVIKVNIIFLYYYLMLVFCERGISNDPAFHSHGQACWTARALGTGAAEGEQVVPRTTFPGSWSGCSCTVPDEKAAVEGGH